MKYSNEKNTKEEPIYLLIGGVIILVFVVLFCVIVWGVTHRKDNDITISSSSVVSEESSSEVQENVDVVAPIESIEVPESSEEEGLDYNDTSNDMGLVFEEIEDKVTAKDVTNLRSEPSTGQGQATVVAQLRNGETATRIGKEETTGWSKLVYDGQIVYASSNYLIVVEE